MKLAGKTSADALLLVIMAVLGFVLGHRSLPPYDFGWHLAGGLWMLEHGNVPLSDPFGAEGAFWLCYSWLFEVASALLFSLGGFDILQSTQSLFVVFMTMAACFYVRFFSSRAGNANSPPELLALLVLLLLSSAFWYLRPQTLSLVFFGFLLVLAESKRLHLAYLVPLTLLWANIHVYWLAVPAIVFLYSVLLPPQSATVRERLRALFTALLCMLTAAVNPYGTQMFFGMFEYAFDHEVGYGLITEFKGLSSEQGLYFYLTLLSLLGILCRAKYAFQRVSAALLCLWFLSALAAFAQIKYLGFFALTSAGVIPNLFESKEEEKNSGSLSPVLFGISILAFFSATWALFEPAPALSSRHQELLQIADELQVREGGTEEFVFNDFNDGGWLALALWLARPQGVLSSPLKTTIDGRTLVMGAKRLSEYQKIALNHPQWCQTLKSWNATSAILPKGSPLSQALLEDYNSDACPGYWQIVRRFEHWVLLSFSTTQGPQS